MVIVVNTRLLLKDRLEGIGWFTYETMSRITRNHPEHRFVFVFDRSYDSSFIFSDNVIAEVVSPPTRHPFLWYLWFDWRIPAILKKHSADLFISTDGYLSTRTDTPQLAVIHDLNFVHRPKDLPIFTSLYYNRFFPVFARRACRIATVSTYSKNDIAATYGISPSKIDIVWSGRHRVYTPVEEPQQKIVRQKYTDGAPYFLYIGSLHPRKNVDGLLTAFDQFKRESGSPVKLVIVGGKMFKTGNISKLYNAMEYRDEVIFTGRIPVEEVRLVLGSALAVTFVPFFEGFGLPLTEGMSAGVPVICSNTTALPEIGGNAALFTDPYEPGQIAEAMKEICTNEALRKDLIAKGHIRKEEFTWDLTADLLWKSVEKAFAELGKPI